MESVDWLPESNLSEALQEKLAEMPEIAMGYQLVDVLLTNGATLNKRYVASGQYIDLPPGLDPSTVVDIVRAYQRGEE